MKTMRRIKLALDVVMALSLITLYSKNFLGIAYHEIMGLAVLLPVIAHICINIRTVRNMCSKFGAVPVNIKIGLIIDILLLIVFAWEGISGILISRTILTGISANSIFFKLSHNLLGTVSLILLGIHIGLHLYGVRFTTVTAVIFTVAAIALAVFGYMGTGNTKGRGMDFSPESEGFNASDMQEMPRMSGDYNMPDSGDKDRAAPNGDFSGMPQGGNNFNGTGTDGKGDFRQMPQNGQDFENMPDMGNMPDMSSDSIPGQFQNGNFGDMTGFSENNGGSNPVQKAAMLAKTLGVMSVCAMMTWWALCLQRRRKIKSPTPELQEDNN